MENRLQAASALLPELEAFHKVQGQVLRTAQLSADETELALTYDNGVLILRANTDDDTVLFEVISHRTFPYPDVSHEYPWQDFLGLKTGWGWVTINQQGYIDGVLLSYGDGILPSICVNVVASTLKVGTVDFQQAAHGVKA